MCISSPSPRALSCKRRFPPALIAAGLLAFLGSFSPCASAQAAPETVRSAPEGSPEWIGDIRAARDVAGKGSWLKRAARFVIGIEDNDRTLLMPNGVHVDSDGRILVADTRARVVHVFDRPKRKYQALRPPASNPFASPIAVATDAAGRIYVSDSVRSRIFVFSHDGKFLRTIGGLDKKESIFQRSTGLAIDQKRERMYVVDTAAMRVVILSLDGQVLGRIGQRGIGPGEFNFPTHAAIAPDGTLWVTDSLNFRVQHFDGDGRFLSSFGRHGDGPGDFDKAKGIAVDSRGRVYVVEGFNDRVQVFDDAGRLLFVFGKTGHGQAEFCLPAGVALVGSNQIVVADSYNSRLELFRLGNSPGSPGGN